MEIAQTPQPPSAWIPCASTFLLHNAMFVPTELLHYKRQPNKTSNRQLDLVSIALKIKHPACFTKPSSACGEGTQAARTVVTPQGDWGREGTPFTAEGCSLNEDSTAAGQTVCGKYTAVADVGCTQGYKGGGSIECKADGTWTDLPPCLSTGDSCGLLNVFYSNQGPGAVNRSNDRAYGTTVAVRCNEGYAGSESTTCSSVGEKWTPLPECTPCPIGEYQKQGGLTCISCEAGQHTKRDKQYGSCDPCKLGDYSSETHTECVSCPVGKYADDAAHTEDACIRCGPSLSPAPKSPSISLVAPCLRGCRHVITLVEHTYRTRLLSIMQDNAWTGMSAF